MTEYARHFSGEEEMRSFISECEKIYKDQINSVASGILSSCETRFIMLSGPTCSGKTTTSKILIENFEKHGKNVRAISIDDFYKSRDELIALAGENGEPDFESASAIDIAYFSECVEKMLAGREVMLPVFDFVAGERTEYLKYVPSEGDMIIFEGIQALYPEITENIPRDKRKSVFISVADDLWAYGKGFDRELIRFLRRLVRDYQFRASSPHRTLFLYRGVLQNEHDNLNLLSKNVDYNINSLLLYELNVIKKYVLELVEYDPEMPDEIKLFEYLQKLFADVPQMPSALVPADSVFREFIGRQPF